MGTRLSLSAVLMSRLSLDIHEIDAAEGNPEDTEELLSRSMLFETHVMEVQGNGHADRFRNAGGPEA